MQKFSLPPSALFLVTGLVLLGGCGKPDTLRSQTDSGARPSQSERSVSAREGEGSLEQRRANFLNQIRAADPDKATIERALINEKNELGIILSRKTNIDEVPKLLKSMLIQMNQSFPDQDLTVVAYTPTDPPHTIGTAHLDARTRDMTYQPASPR